MKRIKKEGLKKLLLLGIIKMEDFENSAKNAIIGIESAKAERSKTEAGESAALPKKIRQSKIVEATVRPNVNM